MVCSNTDRASTRPSVRVTVTHTGVPAVFRLWLATEPCRYKVSAVNPYMVGTTIGHPPVIAPRWATSPASSTAYRDSRSARPRCRYLRCRVRSVADSGSFPPAGLVVAGPAVGGLAVRASRLPGTASAVPGRSGDRALIAASWLG